MGQGYEDHLVTPKDAIPDVDKVQWKKIDAQLCSVLWQSVDPKILHHLRAYKTCFKFWTQATGLFPSSSLMHKSLIPSFFLPNLFISFLLVSLAVLVLFILSHLDRTSSPPSYEMHLLRILPTSKGLSLLFP